MYTPINWANPNNLDLIKEKREAERLENPQMNETINNKKTIKTKLIDTLNRAFAFRLKPSLEI